MLQATLWYLCAGAVGMAAASFLGDRRRVRRRDPDAVGWVNWSLLLILSILFAAIFAAFAIKAG
jgi:hypothetical protein